MPRTFETTVFTFDELTDEAKKTALVAMEEQAHRYFEPSHLSDWFHEELGRKGLPGADLEWSLAYSQGDGVAFYGDIELDDCLRAMKKLTKYRALREPGYTSDTTGIRYPGDWKVSVELTRNDYATHYAHANTMSVNVEWRYLTDADPSPVYDALMEALYADIKAYVQTTSRELEKAGYSEIEYLTTDEEKLSEDARANEQEFDAEGNITY